MSAADPALERQSTSRFSTATRPRPRNRRGAEGRRGHEVERHPDHRLARRQRLAKGRADTESLGAKTVLVAYDADARTNPAVAGALARLVRDLAGHGFAVELEIWNVADGKGIDDLLHAGSRRKC